MEKAIVKCFKLFDEYYLYDFSTSKIFKINKGDYLKYREDELAINDIPKSVKSVEIIEHPQTYLMKSFLDNNIYQLILQVTQNCNFRCKYCSFSGSGYLNRKHEKINMSWSIAKKAIDFYIIHSINIKRPNIGFYGGEPFLNFEVINKSIKYLNKIYGINNVNYNITSNLSIMNDEILKILIDNNISLLISLDGPKYIQNRNRRFAINGVGTFDLVYENIKKIYEKNEEYFINKVKINAVTDMKDDYQKIKEFFLNDNILSKVQFDIVVESNELNEQVLFNTDAFNINLQKDILNELLSNIKKIDTDSYNWPTGRFVNDVYKVEVLLKSRDYIPRKFHHSGPCIPGQKRLFVDVKGKFYPCEKIAENNVLTIGNVEEGFDYNKCNLFLNIGKISEDECKKCWAMEYCAVCVSKCYNEDKISAEVKKQNCNLAKIAAVENFKKYTEYSEILKMYMKWRNRDAKKTNT